MQVRKNQTLVLVGEAVDAESIDASEANRRLEEARAALDRANEGEGDVYAARREVGFAEALVKTAAS